MAVPHTNRVLSHLFDIRNIIGALLAIYGVVLTIAGFAPAILRSHDDPAAAGNRSDLYIGTDANWWVGLIMLAVAAGFIVWALVRPLKAEEVAAQKVSTTDISD
jgi:H+/Cl- antiporter ClcA